MSRSLPKQQGPGVRQRKAVAGLQGVLQAPRSCSDSRGWTPISGRGLGAATTSALTGSQAGPGVWPEAPWRPWVVQPLQER